MPRNRAATDGRATTNGGAATDGRAATNGGAATDGGAAADDAAAAVATWARRLTPRLRLIVDLLTPCERLADVGTDHGLVPIAAVARGLAARAWGVDAKAGPLAEARRTLAEARLAPTDAGEQRVELRLGAGFEALGDVAPDAVVMAGLGARTMIATFEARPAVLAGVRQLVLQPLSEPERLRGWARTAGWRLVREAVVREKSRWLPVMRFEPGPERMPGPGATPDPAYAIAGFTPAELEVLGPLLVRGGDADARAFFAHEAARRAGDDARAGRAPGPITRAFMRAAEGSATMPAFPPDPEVPS